MASRKSIFTVGLVVLGLLAAPTPALAAGYGFNFIYGYRWGTVENVDFAFIENDLVSNDITFGFTLDTAVATDRVFNYRLNLNYEHQIYEFNDSGITVKSNGVGIENIFGFGVLRTRNLRLWLGPAIRIAVAGINDQGLEAIVADFGIGLVSGLNIHMGDAASAGLTFGYEYNGSLLAIETGAVSDELQTGGVHRISVGIAILFRSASDIYMPRR